MTTKEPECRLPGYYKLMHVALEAHSALILFAYDKDETKFHMLSVPLASLNRSWLADYWLMMNRRYPDASLHLDELRTLQDLIDEAKE